MADTFSVRISDYEAMIERIGPLDPPASWTAEEIVMRLAEEGVTHGVMLDRLEQLAEQLNGGEAARNVRVARGTRPAAAGWVQLRQAGEIVLPGDALCRNDPARSGVTVRGLELPPPDVQPVQIVPGKQAGFDESKQQILAGVYGRVAYRGDQVQVEPMIRVSADRLFAEIDLVPATGDGHPVTLEDIQRALQAEGIVHGIDAPAIEQALEQAREKKAPVLGVRAARGTPPVDGVDGRLDFELDVERRVGRASVETGRIDFRERNTVHSVRQGDVICRLVLPQPDEPGVDVYGKAVAGYPGQDPPMPKLENITFDETRLDFVADMSGGLIRGAGTLAVTPIVVVEGDVDLESGNLHADEASVNVRGSVKDTFEITTSGAVSVAGEVGDARIVCGGQLSVGGGVVMKDKGRIEAGGTVSARFFQNATVIAGGDILIGDSAVNCRFEAGGQVIAALGKGRIIGGMIQARGGVSARTIGSEAEVPTEVVIEQDEIFERIKQAGHRLRNELQEIGRLIGEEPAPAARLLALPAPKRAAVEALQRYRDLAAFDLRALDDLRDPLLVGGRKQAGTVCAREVIHPGVRVTIADRTLELAHPLQACLVRYDPQHDRLVTSPAGTAQQQAEEETAKQADERRRRQQEVEQRLEAMLEEADRLDLPRWLQTLRDLGEAGVRVLVADDHKLTRSILRRLLEKCGYTVFEDGGATVISSILQHSVDLVLLDIAFPGGKSGIEICKQIKSTRALKDLPVIMMTVPREKSIIQQAMLARADDLILKPFTQETVMAKVEKALSGKAADPA